jgi:hypothetical protein
MKVRRVRRIAGAFVAAILGASGALGQNNPAPSVADQGAPQFTAEQLDQMVAPIALYPDPLLAQILMAATYPLEVVEADRWVHDPNHAALEGDRLAGVLEQEPWDPSVKSLVPFPQILRMMDLNLEWTERLGEAFLADQAAMMDSIQRLRRRAKSAGKLDSTPQETVTTEGEGQPIVIEPLNPQSVYVPTYEPADVYGAWPYPAYPPTSFPGFFSGGDAIVTVIAPLCGWNHWDWVHHRIELDRDRFAVLNHNRQPIAGLTWEHDPLHRLGVAYRDPGVRHRFAGETGTAEMRRALRGYPTIAPPEIKAPLPAIGQPSMSKPAYSPHMPPAFGSLGHGGDARIPGRPISGRMAPPGRPATRPPINAGGGRVSPYGR